MVEKIKQIEIALWAIRNHAHQIGLYVETVLMALGLMEPEQRLFYSKKERNMMDRDGNNND